MTFLGDIVYIDMTVVCIVLPMTFLGDILPLKSLDIIEYGFFSGIHQTACRLQCFELLNTFLLFNVIYHKIICAKEVLIYSSFVSVFPFMAFPSKHYVHRI